jgi:Fe-S cluster assembly protein SufD
VFASLLLPTESEEVWRYSPINELKLDAYSPAQPGSDPVDGQALLDSVAAEFGPFSGRVLVVNGFPGAPATTGPPGTFRFGLSEEWPEAKSMVGSVQEGGDALVRLNDAFLPDAVLLDVPDGNEIADPFLIVHWCDQEGAAACPRTVVRLGTHARAAVVEVYAGPTAGGRVLALPVTELSAGDGASLSYASMQILNDNAWSIARLTARGGRDATVRTFTVGLGGAYDRVRADVRAEGKGGRSEILSTYFGNGTQVHDVRTLQDHVAPRTESELLCQGAVAGTSRSVYSGLIRVHRGAVRTDARQTNHNLVLDEGAHADSVPNLDILENDVRCSHASTVGPIDDDQRYYIESRGVEPDVAEGLIVRGFFDAIIDRGPIPAVTPLLKREVRSRLDAAFGDRKVPSDV